MEINEIITKIVEENNLARLNENIFLYWENELALREQIRTLNEWRGLQMESAEDFSFIKRSFYYGANKSAFWEILFQNLNKQPIVKCLADSYPPLAHEFLSFLPGYILEHEMEPEKLNFLITIYKKEYHSLYIELINILDLKYCNYLVARTSSKSLRDLLKARLNEAASRSKHLHYGLIDDNRTSRHEYPTLYGDKIQNIKAAIKILSALPLDKNAPLSLGLMDTVLQGADYLFKAGLLTDCLALLAEVAVMLRDEKNPAFADNLEAFFKPVNQVLRKAIPIYSLLVDAAEPHRYALELMRSFFPGFNPDLASFLYLDLYSIVLSNLQGRRQYARYELAQKALKILANRPEDILAEFVLNWSSVSPIRDFSSLEKEIELRIPAQPHEALVIMELLRFGEQEKILSLTPPTATHLLNLYMQFFRWIPAATFINQNLLGQLGRLAEESSKKAGERILSVFQSYPVQAGPEKSLPISEVPNPEIQKLMHELKLSKYMGVIR